MSNFGYLGKKLQSISKKKRKAKKNSERKKIKTPKTEGTAITYGQAFHFPFPELEGSGPSATVVGKRRFSDKTSSKSDSNAERISTIPFIAPVAPISKNPPAVATSQNLSSITQNLRKVSKEKIVKIVRKTEDIGTTISGKSSGLPRRIKSDIAIAAASSNKGATVVLPKTKFVNPTKRSDQLVGSILNDVAKIAPNVEETVVVISSHIKSQAEIKEALEESRKVDLTITLKSKRTESLELNTLKVPELNTNFVYNFFTNDEEDIEEQEDQENDPLLEDKPIDVPRYLDLRWNIVDVTEVLAGSEAKIRRQKGDIFKRSRGVSGHNSDSFSNSVEKKKKKIAPIQREGINRKIVDVHNPEEAFKKIANKTLFANSLPAVLSTVFNEDDLFSIPIREKEKDSKAEPSEELTTDAPFAFPGVRKRGNQSLFSFGRAGKRKK